MSGFLSDSAMQVSQRFAYQSAYVVRRAMSIESPGQARTQSNPDNDWDRQGELRVDTSSSLRASPLPFATRTITISNSDSAAELLGRCSAKPLSRSAKSCCVLRAACCVLRVLVLVLVHTCLRAPRVGQRYGTHHDMEGEDTTELFSGSVLHIP